MTKPAPDKTVVLISLPTEYEAILMVQALEARGIAAYATGALTSGFRAEAPGEVQVLIHESDLDQAREALRDLGKA